MQDFPVPSAIRAGDTTKTNPFTILVVANPALEAPWKSGAFVVDPITSNRQGFDACVRYVETSLFGSLPGQAEPLLADPGIAPNVRFLSLFKAGLAAADCFSFAAQDGVSNILVARRVAIRDFLLREGLLADVVFAVSASPSHQRASAWFASDDDAGPGTPFQLDGVSLSHRHNYIVPGTVGLPVNSASLTAIHEFQHAISSYTNGMIVDLYVDSASGLNIKLSPPPKPPVPPDFAVYSPTQYASDPTRGPLGYPSNWKSYHCELHDAANPAVMDNYYLAPSGVPEHCQNDKITRTFIMDRVRAKIGR